MWSNRGRGSTKGPSERRAKHARPLLADATAYRRSDVPMAKDEVPEVFIVGDEDASLGASDGQDLLIRQPRAVAPSYERGIVSADREV